MPITPMDVLRYAMDTPSLHRDLTPHRMQAAANRQEQAVMSSAQISLADAIYTGALHGAAVSRPYLTAITHPVDLLLGAQRSLVAGASVGLLPNLIELPLAAIQLCLRPKLGQAPSARLGRPAAALPARPLAPWVDLGRSSAGNLAALGVGLVAVPVTLATSACLWASNVVSAAVKVSLLAPPALIGAMVGAATHRTQGALGAQGTAPVSRGARNELTFAYMEPVDAIPDAFFFLTEDNFGLDLRELAQLHLARGNLVNPHTNVAFSASDSERLFWHPTQTIRQMPGTPTIDSYFLTPQLWAKHFFIFEDIVLALSHVGADAASYRSQGLASLDHILAEAEPRDALRLQLFFEKLSGVPYHQLRDALIAHPSEAQDFATALLSATTSIGAMMLGVERLMQIVVQGHYETGHGFARTALTSMRELQERFQGKVNMYMALRHPWLARLALPAQERQHMQTPDLRHLRLPAPSYYDFD